MNFKTEDVDPATFYLLDNKIKKINEEAGKDVIVPKNIKNISKASYTICMFVRA